MFPELTEAARVDRRLTARLASLRVLEDAWGHLFRCPTDPTASLSVARARVHALDLGALLQDLNDACRRAQTLYEKECS